nr:interleukin-12 receptor subunit beta-2 [Misgurnus anguillicaudatus]
MSSHCAWLMLVTFPFFLMAGAREKPVCTAQSNIGKEVLVGSNLTVSCVFSKTCTKIIFRDNEEIKNKQSPSSSEVSVDVKDVTELSIFTCRCKEDPEPCGIDITPGYPPDIPQNLTCVRKTEYGNVTCTWKIGRETKITTICHLGVDDGHPLIYSSVMNSTGFCFSTFPIRGSMLQLSVMLNISNSLGSNISGPHNFTLRNIVKPSRPNITHIECFSQRCHLRTDNHSMNLVEVQYKVENQILGSLQTGAEQILNVSSLHPYTTYKFRIRRKINREVGLWSDWSLEKEAETEEEAPKKELDVWYMQDPKSSNCFRIFWKKFSKSEAKGKILRYKLSVQVKRKKNSTILDANITNRPICCDSCSVSVSAINSKGQSPAKFINLRSPESVLDVKSQILSNDSIALFWTKPAIAGPKTEYVVHWYAVGDKEKLWWIRVMNTSIDITGLQPHKCYHGAVTALRSNGPAVAFIHGISTWQSVPEQGPVPQQSWKKSESLEVKWSTISQDKIRGCLRNYSIYLNKLNGSIEHFSVNYSSTQYTISGLSPGECYNLWVTAWTDAGEGPRGSDLPFCTLSDSEKLLSLVILAGGTVLLICLIILCFCQFSSVQKRFLRCCQCLLPTVIPDPANSKCAREYVVEQFHHHQSDSSISEDPDIMQVEEFHSPSGFTCNYIKSFSQESTSSDTTQITRTTDITGDYIYTRGAISGGEEEEEDEEDRSFDEFGFRPCINPFLEPLVLSNGKLDLDAVIINCSEFMDCT